MATGRVYGGESKEDRAQKRREQFLQTGLRLFGTIGYKQVSVRGLCREAKLTDRYFYESFDSVEDVLIQVYEREIQKLAQLIMKSLGEFKEDTPITDVTRPALKAFFEFARDPIVAKTVWIEILGVSPRVDKIYLQGMSDFQDMIIYLVKGLYPKLRLGPVRERSLAVALVGGISQTTMVWIMNEFKTPIEELVEANSMILEGVMMRANAEQNAPRNNHLKATCQCGQFSISLSSPPVAQLTCHCQDCRDVSRNPFTEIAFFPAQSWQMEGKSNKATMRGGSGKAKHYYSCSKCKTTLGAEVEVLRGLFGVVASQIHPPFEYKPTCHVWTSEKVDGANIPADMPAFPKAPPVAPGR